MLYMQGRRVDIVNFESAYFLTVEFGLRALRNHGYVLRSIKKGDSNGPRCHPNHGGEIKVAIRKLLAMRSRRMLLSQTYPWALMDSGGVNVIFDPTSENLTM